VTVRFAAAAIAIASSLAIAGCGFGAGRGTSNVRLTVTRDFGSHAVGALNASHVPGSETVMRMLERNFHVGTRYGGGFVESINGLSGTANGRDWFYYVNGMQAQIGAAQMVVHRGDRIWWDLHDWTAPEQPEAVVGSFPEPFVHGTGGKRLPTVLECGPGVDAACRRVSAALRAVGVPIANQLLGTGSGTDSLEVLVAPWEAIKGSFAGELIEHGPAASGVYAKFADNSLELLDPAGHVVRTLPAGAGLIAATSQSSAPPTWLITGTDAAGVAAAASALNARSLDDHFALAVKGHQQLALPQERGA
jgi:hypothetical protein